MFNFACELAGTLDLDFQNLSGGLENNQNARHGVLAEQFHIFIHNCKDNYAVYNYSFVLLFIRERDPHIFLGYDKTILQNYQVF